ncbi:MAG: FGGY-family carbohydrate kinase [Rhodospirillales bacterium]|nr:FGGY-family carbohydrate kinase [Rhodospirillales bacterium]
MFIGIDGGTESLRARVFDLGGRCLGNGSAPYETRFAAGARAEQEPEDWWNAAGRAVRAAVAEAGIAPGQVEALSIDTTCCTVVALDADGRALRPAILWMDMRAGPEAADVLATGDAALAVNGAGQGPVSAEWMIPKALWLARHEPRVFDAAATVCEYQDFMTRRLTGRRTASLNNAAVRWHYGAAGAGFPASLVRTLGVAALLEKWPGEVLPPGAVIGPLTRDAADHLGLPQTVKVVQGGADAFIGMIGLGVAQPGQLAMITGSSHLQFGVSDRASHVAGLWGTYKDAVYPGRYILEGGQTSTGSVVNWLRRLVGGTLDFASLNEAAAKLPPGAEGLLALDHFQGNRTPHTDPLARGALTGLSLHHGLPHIFRAVLEAIGCGTRAIVDRMREAGFGASEIVVGGGATNSPLWLQIHADTANLPVVVPDVSEAPALGCAILAAVGAGRFGSIDEGVAAMVRPGRRIEPIPANVARYDEIFARYSALYTALKPLRAPAEPVAG